MDRFKKYLFKKLGLITKEDIVILENSLKSEILSLKVENERLRKSLKSKYFTTLKKTNDNLKSLEKGLAVIQANSLVNDLKEIIKSK